MDDKDNKNEIDRIEMLHTRMAQYVKEKTDGNIENFGKLWKTLWCRKKYYV